MRMDYDKQSNVRSVPVRNHFVNYKVKKAGFERAGRFAARREIYSRVTSFEASEKQQESDDRKVNGDEGRPQPVPRESCDDCASSLYGQTLAQRL